MAKVKVYCKDCKAYYMIADDKPLMEVLPGHGWWHTRRDGTMMVRHPTYEDRLAEQADRELCPVCSVPHGSRALATTGCYPEANQRGERR